MICLDSLQYDYRATRPQYDYRATRPQYDYRATHSTLPGQRTLDLTLNLFKII